MRQQGERRDTTHLAVLGAAGVQACRPIVVQRVNLGAEQVPFAEEGAHGQFVALALPPLHAARQVDGGEVQVRLLVAGNVNLPSFGQDLGNAADHDVAHLSQVAGAAGPDADELVDALHRPGH